MRAARQGSIPLILVLAIGWGIFGCSGPDPVPEAPPAEVGVPDPDLTGIEPLVVQALGRAREAVLADPGSADAWGDLGSSYDGHLLYDVAELCYRRANELAPDDFRWIYLLAISREVNGADSEEVITRFNRAMEMRPDYAPVYLRLGDALWRRGEYEAAHARLRQSLERDPNNAMAHQRLGQVMLALGKAQEALPYLLRAVELEPRDLGAHKALAQAYGKLGQSERAQEVIARSQGLEPFRVIDDPVYSDQVTARIMTSNRLFSRAVSRVDRGEYAEALEELKIVESVRPENPSLHYWMGTAYQRLGQFEAAIEHLSRAVAIEEAMNPARLQLAQVLALRGKGDEAAAHCEQALRYAPSDPGVYLVLAEVRFRQQDAAGVVAAYQKADELGSLNAAHRVSYGRALMFLGDTEAAVEQYLESLRLNADNPGVHYDLGIAYEKLGDTARAVEHYEEAVRLEPSHPATERLGELRKGG